MKFKYISAGFVYFLATALAVPTGDASFQVSSSQAISSEVGGIVKRARRVPCGESFLSRLHDSSHCVFFFIPQGSAHPENNQHFHNCCFGKWKAYNQRIKEEAAEETTGGESTAGGGDDGKEFTDGGGEDGEEFTDGGGDDDKDGKNDAE